MTPHFCFYDNATGLFSGRSGRYADEAMAQANAPEGFTALQGAFDRNSQRFEIESGNVIDYQPPSPGADYEWSAERKRYSKSLAAVQRDGLIAFAQQSIEMLERSQLRPIRELALDPANVAAKSRLQQIEDAIAVHRQSLVAAAVEFSNNE
jgi:hypothetical protein